MRVLDFPHWLRDTMLRMFPHRAPTGLVSIGKPGRDSPVLVTGNFTLTVRRLVAALSGHDAWLLCANSQGINVWCAASGGHLTHHDIISVLRTSGIAAEVDHRVLVLPQLCATGVEPQKITDATGWSTRWGPAHLEDLPAFLRRGQCIAAKERSVRFPFAARMEMAFMWAWVLIVVAALVAWGIGSWAMAVSAIAIIVAIVGGMFAALPWLIVTGARRWFTFSAFAIVSFGVGVAILAVLGAVTSAHLWLAASTAVVTIAVLSIDLAGTTPLYGSYINTFHNQAHIDLVTDRCTGAADCVQVCPRDVLQMTTHRKVEIRQPDQCIQCGACIVQCPRDALRFRYDDHRIVEAETVRRTRMNLLGRRTVEVPES